MARVMLFGRRSGLRLTLMTGIKWPLFKKKIPLDFTKLCRRNFQPLMLVACESQFFFITEFLKRTKDLIEKCDRLFV